MKFVIHGLLRQTVHETLQQLTSQHRNIHCRSCQLVTTCPVLSVQFQVATPRQASGFCNIAHVVGALIKTFFVDEISLLTSGKLLLTSSATCCSPWAIQVK
jgi:hypothetical protein